MIRIQLPPSEVQRLEGEFRLIEEALAENRHVEFKRRPSYSPQLNPIERFWK